MNGQPEVRLTRAQQRAATRLSLLEATAQCLMDDGYAGLMTRAVAERAGVAQSTLMHYFPTREAFLAETVTHLAMRLADDALDRIDLSGLQRPDRRDEVLDQAWRQFTSPEALAVVQLWIAAWSEPELAATLRDLEQRLGSIFIATAAALFPEEAEDPRFPALIDATISLIRGLVVGIPISGREVTDARFRAMKPMLLQAAADLLDG
jgi:AcrR family transcriptional regulator